MYDHTRDRAQIESIIEVLVDQPQKGEASLWRSEIVIKADYGRNAEVGYKLSSFITRPSDQDILPEIVSWQAFVIQEQCPNHRFILTRSVKNEHSEPRFSGYEFR